jgi:hypothetical protein
MPIDFGRTADALLGRRRSRFLSAQKFFRRKSPRSLKNSRAYFDVDAPTEFNLSRDFSQFYTRKMRFFFHAVRA